MKVTVYSKPFCGGCEKVKEFLADNGVEFEVKDTSKEPEAKAEVIEMGYMSVPVTKVVTGDNVIHFGGYEPDKLDEIARAYNGR